MALDKAALGALIKTKLVAAVPAPSDDALLTKVCNAIADAVVTHVQSAATVTATGVVTTGAGSGGAVTATGTVS